MPADSAAPDTWRAHLIARRDALADTEFRRLSKAVVDQVERALAGNWRRRYGLYWPRPREVALFALVRRMLEAGGLAGLPCPPGADETLRFRAWTPGDPLARAASGLSFPRDGPLVQPEILFIPLVGFDRANYRLGYGGGSYARLIAREPGVRTIGVGFEFMRLESAQPCPVDRPLDLVITEAGATTARQPGASPSPA